MGEDDQDSVWLDIESLSLGNGLPISLVNRLPFVLNIKKISYCDTNRISIRSWDGKAKTLLPITPKQG